jgi:hypothetical protein
VSFVCDPLPDGPPKRRLSPIVVEAVTRALETDLGDGLSLHRVCVLSGYSHGTARDVLLLLRSQGKADRNDRGVWVAIRP